MKTISFLRVGIIVLLLLTIPFMAMQFTSEVNWSLLDFTIVGILLSSLGLGIEWIITKSYNIRKTVILIFLLFIIIGLIWGEIAVGIFGTPFAGK